MDAFEGNKPLTVSEAMARAKGALEGIVVTLVGEVSEVSNKPGYKAVYFTVKDASASLPCMMWNNRFAQAGVALRPGMLVRLTGRFTLYAAKGRMNFDVFALSLAGEGDLRERVAALARKLQAEGLMDPVRKRPIPAYPQTVGLVTSPRGAAVHDVLRTLRRRWPCARVVLAGVPVEGAGAPAAIIEGLGACAAAGAEVVLLVRGGGSFEDLMPFNDEGLARAVAACPVPVVTGIGHEPDTSIADMVADVRASTPTAAAETVSPEAPQLQAALAGTQGSLSRSLLRCVERRALELDRLASRPVFRDSSSLFSQDALGLDALGERLTRAIPGNLERDARALEAYRSRLAAVGRGVVSPHESAWALRGSRLDDLSPLSVLRRGWALARNESGAVVSSVSQAPKGSRISIALSDGELDALVLSSRASD